MSKKTEKHLYRYRLQEERPYTYFNRTAKPVPIHTTRWIDIALSDYKEELQKVIIGGGKYRIEDTEKGVFYEQKT